MASIAIPIEVAANRATIVAINFISIPHSKILLERHNQRLKRMRDLK
jgi:hypothetical protein